MRSVTPLRNALFQVGSGKPLQPMQPPERPRRGGGVSRVWLLSVPAIAMLCYLLLNP